MIGLRRLALRDLIRSVLISATGWAIATIFMSLALHLVRMRHSSETVPFLLVLVGGGLAVAMTARSSARQRDIDSADLEGWAWGLAYTAAVLVFWYWVPLTHSLTFASRSTQNVITLGQSADTGDMTKAYPPIQQTSSSVHLSDVQVRLFVAVCVFGVLGGFVSRIPDRSAERRIGDSILSALIWGLAVIAGGLCLFVGFYIFVGLFATLLRPAVGVGVAIGAGLAGFAGGTVSAAIAVPTLYRLVDFTRQKAA